MKATDFWANAAKEIVAATGVLDKGDVLDKGVLEMPGTEDTPPIEVRLGVLSGFYISASNAANLEIARNDVNNLVQIGTVLVLRFIPMPEILRNLEKVEFYFHDYQTGEDIRLDDERAWDYLSEDSVHFLLHNLCFGNEGYLYQVDRFAKDDLKPLNRLFQPNPKPEKFLDIIGENGVANYSTTARNVKNRRDLDGNNKLKRESSIRIPLANNESFASQNIDGVTVYTTLFDAITTLHPTARWYENTVETAQKSRNAVLFHELWEIWERTHNLLPYVYPLYDERGNARHRSVLEVLPDNSIPGADQKAVLAEENFWNQSNLPGKFAIVRFN